MNGQFGVLYKEGRQVGGFKAWSMKCDLQPVLDKGGWATYQPSLWKAVGKNPFFLEVPHDSIFDVTFFNVVNEQLVPVYSETVKGILPNTFPINEYLAFSMAMVKYEH